ncbi:hypothetical protein CsSME_00043482 [Camellia sinensis var. sinensis]
MASPFDIDVWNFVSDSLTGNNYQQWRQQMHNLIEEHGLVGSINGTIEASRENHSERENYMSWKRSDDVLQKWIRATLSKGICKEVKNFKTARGLWEMLEKWFGHYVPLHKAATEGDWETANEFIRREPDIAMRAGITEESETMLIVAVKSKRRNNFVKNLVKHMLREDLALGDTRKRTALHRAAGAGNIEAAKLLVKENPYLPNAQNYDKQIPLFYAAARVPLKFENITEHKRKPDIENAAKGCIYGVYSDICSSPLFFLSVFDKFIEESKTIFLSQWDESKNNALHLAGYLASPQQLYLRAGAALQMQRELQWFKEVEKHILPRNKEERNNKEMTPAEVFTDTHKDLVKEGEQWMKGTANACSIVAALIATVVFAAAITVPGGNNGNGSPIFNKRASFLIFGIFDAFALFSSITSVLLFLSILTSRYAEDDFLVTLPRRLIFGLLTLFLSILSTMIAFGATLYLVFEESYKAWIIIPVFVLPVIPVGFFVFLQSPLLLDMFKSTYCSIFLKQSDGMLY